MPITTEQIDHLARLARLELTLAEKKTYQKDISAILEYVKKIQEIHEKTPKIIIPVGTDDIGRVDVVANCSTDEREAIINAFPEKEENMNKVKAVFE